MSQISELDLLLRILTASNSVTPTITSLVALIKSGRAARKSDDEIQAESMEIALRIRSKSKEQMGDQA